MSHPHQHITHPKTHTIVRTMAGRDQNETHRVATTLELLFDLIFVVAIAFAGVELHHSITANHFEQGLLNYCIVFVAIWWAWVNFSWFSSAFDTDDVPYRILTFIQMAGALVIAAGVPSAFGGDMRTIAVGYSLMRAAAIVQWLRASVQSPHHRIAARRYALGLFVVQILWLLYAFGPFQPFGLPIFFVFTFLDMLVPVWAEWHKQTPWHPHHIAERYGLLTIIVLGESILSGANAIKVSAEQHQFSLDIALFAFGALLTVFCMWWLYFEDEVGDKLVGFKQTLYWGYGHYFIFSATAAAGAGLAVQVDFLLGKSHASSAITGLSLTAPVAVYLITLWLIQKRTAKAHHGAWLFPLTACLLLSLAWLAPVNSLWIGLILSGLIALRIFLLTKK